MKKLILSLITLLAPPLTEAATQPQKPIHIKATFYADHYEGKTMANGKPYRHRNYTCASWDYPLGTRLWVSYNPEPTYYRWVIVTVTDRGPKKSLGPRIDLSKDAFRRLENLREGIINVTVQPIK